MYSARQTAASLKKLQAQVETELRILGAMEDPEDPTPFRLMTQAGFVDIHPMDDDVCCRFEDVARAVTLLGTDDVNLNSRSGKWNFHGAGQVQVFIEAIREIAVAQPQLPRTTLLSLPGEWETTPDGLLVRASEDGFAMTARLTASGLSLEVLAPPINKDREPEPIMRRSLTPQEIQGSIDLTVSRMQSALDQGRRRMKKAAAESPAP